MYFQGACGGLTGVIRGEHVTFKRKTTVEVEKKKLSALMKQDSLLKAHWTVTDQSQGNILFVFLADGTRMTLAVTFSTTAEEIVQQISDKIEMKENSIFQLVDVSEGIGEIFFHFFSLEFNLK